jgi:hypothetical protein
VGIEGQEERIHMSEKVAPVVIDKDGNPKRASQAVQRLAREIVERSGANPVDHFNRVVFGKVTFRDQTKEYLRWAGSRDRKLIKDLVSVVAALTCLSSIGRNSAVRRSRRKPSTNSFKKAMAMNRHYIFCLLHPECEFQRRLRSKGEILPTTGVRFRCGSKFTARNPSSSPNLKTDAVYREIDLHPEVAEYLRVFICGKDGLLFKTRNGTCTTNIEERWLTERLKAMQLDERGMGWHAFRRFRNTWLRGRRCQEDIKNFWIDHKPRTMSELYSHPFEEEELRLAEKRASGRWIRYSCLYWSKLFQRICAIRRSGQYVSGCEIMELPRMGG